MNKKVVLSVAIAIIMIIVIVSAYAFVRHSKGSVNMEQHTEVEIPESNLEVEDKMLILSGWVSTDELFVMSEPSDTSDIVGSLSFNEEFEYVVYSSDWFEIVNNDVTGYVSSSHVLDKDTGYASYEQYALDTVIGYTSYDVPITSGFKSYMDYRAITSTDSKQYELQNEYATTGDYGIRMVGNRYCVAVGSHFTDKVGQYIDLVLENGTVIPCILADQKADVHTDSNNIVTMHNGCMSEFVVDTNFLDNSVKNYGNISYCNSDWDSKVIEVRVYNKNIFE